ncbi:zinc finger protein 391-like isoform X3 [Periplaneta americana]|uniref:zinc finger protein 391-like isoform X3 n=2 Tax=Periplaneta americana TaxID=6978 RepID=UPI0037E75121
MDVIKKEPEVDPLSIQSSDNTDTDEKKPLSEEGNLSHLKTTGMKAECLDHSYDIKTEIKVEDTPVPVSFPMLKTEVDVVMDVIKLEREVDPLALERSNSPSTDIEEQKPLSEEENVLDLQMTEIKREYMDKNCDLKSEITFDETPVLVDFPIVKSEIEEARELNKVNVEMKVEVTAGDDEVLTERFADTHDITVSSEYEGIAHEESMTICQATKHSVSSATNLRTDTDEKRFSCDICGKCFSEPCNLKSHKIQHIDGKPFKCSFCGNCFPRSSALRRHERLHTNEKSFKCNVCAKYFPQPYDLKLHKLQHTNEKRFKCEICGICFMWARNLKRHGRMHTDVKPFTCDVCGKCFKDSCDLKRHGRLHTGLKPYICDVCGKCFAQSGGLKTHGRVHSGEKPFTCDVCGKCFKQSHSLKRHCQLKQH